MISEETQGTRVLSVPLSEWDKLKHQAEIVLQENQILSDQKIVYKRIIDELSNELHSKTYNQSKEILWLMQDKNTLEEEILLANQEKERLKDKIQEQSKAYSNVEAKCKEKLHEASTIYSNLQEKYEELQMELGKKIDMTLYKQKMEQLSKSKTNEIKIVMNENNSLKSRLQILNNEKERLEIKLVKSAGTSYKIRAHFLESEVKRLKYQLSHSLKRAEEASCQELVFRKTLSKLIKISETRIIDRKTLVTALRNEKAKHGQFKETLKYIYKSNSIDPDDACEYEFNNKNLNDSPANMLDSMATDNNFPDNDYGGNTFSEGNYVDNTYGDMKYNENKVEPTDNINNIIGSSFNDIKKIFQYNSGNENETGANYENGKGDERKYVASPELDDVVEGNTVRDICRKYNIPISDISIV